MIKKIMRLFLVLLLVLVSVSCGEIKETSTATTSGMEDASDYFPLKIGNSWIFDTNLDVELVYEVSESCGNGCFVIDSKVNDIVTQKENYRIDGGNLVATQRKYASGTFDFDPPQIALKVMENGGTWEWRGKLAGADAYLKGTSLGIEKVTVPAGTFDAYQIELVIELTEEGFVSNVASYRYYVEGIGLVKEDSTIMQGESSTHIVGELKSYDLK